ncbi:hypothetical protein HS125_16500 [bacterium]|nr:hypothetical protein [bacterium]
MKAALDELAAAQAAAAAKYQDAHNKGMEVNEIEMILRDVNQQRIKARALVHTIDMGRVTAEAEAGRRQAERALALADAALAEYVFRRQGLGVSTLIITLLAILLYVKIRLISARREE